MPTRARSPRRGRSSPSRRMSQLLSSDKRVEQVADQDHRDEEPEEVRATHVRDERRQGHRGAHTLSTPAIRTSSRANAASATTTETTSMPPLSMLERHVHITILTAGITILFRPAHPP